MNSPARQFNLPVLLVLSLGHMTTDIYQGALPAVLPFLKERLDLSYTEAGVIMMASGFTSSIIQPLFGYFSDRSGRPALLPLGCIFAAAGFSLLSFSHNYGAVLLLVSISGLGIAAYHPEGFKTAYHFTGRHMASGMSIFSVGGTLGYALGPIVALAVIRSLGFTYLPALLIPALVFIGVLSLSWKIVTVHSGRNAVDRAAGSSSRAGISLPLVVLIGTVIMRSCTHAGLMAYIPFYYISHMGGDPLFAGKLVSVFLLGGVAGTIAGSPLADLWGHKHYLVGSLLLTTLLLPLIFVTDGAGLFLSLGALGMVLISSFTVTTVMAQQLLPRNLGIASGLMVGFAIGTGGIGVTVLGAIADAYGVAVAMKSISVLPLAGFIMSLALRYPAPLSPKE